MQIVRLKLQRQEYRLPIAKGVGCFCKLLTVKVDALHSEVEAIMERADLACDEAPKTRGLPVTQTWMMG